MMELGALVQTKSEQACSGSKKIDSGNTVEPSIERERVDNVSSQQQRTTTTRVVVRPLAIGMASAALPVGSIPNKNKAP
jgi:hypothetical protein